MHNIPVAIIFFVLVALPVGLIRPSLFRLRGWHPNRLEFIGLCSICLTMALGIALAIGPEEMARISGSDDQQIRGAGNDVPEFAVQGAQALQSASAAPDKGLRREQPVQSDEQRWRAELQKPRMFRVFCDYKAEFSNIIKTTEEDLGAGAEADVLIEQRLIELKGRFEDTHKMPLSQALAFAETRDWDKRCRALAEGRGYIDDPTARAADRTDAYVIADALSLRYLNLMNNSGRLAYQGFSAVDCDYQTVRHAKVIGCSMVKEGFGSEKAFFIAGKDRLGLYVAPMNGPGIDLLDGLAALRAPDGQQVKVAVESKSGISLAEARAEF